MAKKVLVIDSDRSFLLQLRNDLGQFKDKFGALLTENATAAIEAIKTHGVALVVAGNQMELDGKPLPITLFQQGLNVPVILVEDAGQAGQADSWESCVVRNLVRPVDTLALAEAVQGVLENEALEGLLHGVSSSSFFQFVEVENKTCTINVTHGSNGRGTLFFSDGQLMDARYRDQDGLAAALKVLGWDKVDLAILNFCPLRKNRIERSIGGLLMEAAVAADHAAAEAQGIQLDTPKPAEPAPPPKEPILKKLSAALNGQDGVDSVTEDASWNDLLNLASVLGKDLDIGDPELCLLAAADGGGDMAVVPDEAPVAIQIGKFASREVVVDKILAALESA